MSTVIYHGDLYTDIWTKEKIAKGLREQADSVDKQIANGCDLIEIHFPQLTIDFDYIDEEISIIV